MSNGFWKTTTASLPRRQIIWPSIGQFILQIIIAGLIAVIWAGLFWGYIQFAGGEPPPAPLPVAEIEPTPTQTPAPTQTPEPSPTPTLVVEPAVTDTVATTPGTSIETETEPTAEPPTDTPTPLPPPTETPLPPTDTPDSPPDEPGEVSFANDVAPILERRCVRCHGGVQDDGTLRIEEGLKLTSHADILAGSWNGPVIEPGNVEDSYLIEQIITGEMPKRGPDLLPAEIRIITAWVEAGALDN